MAAAFPLVAGYGAYDGFRSSRNDATGTLAVALHGPTQEDYGALIRMDGVNGSTIAATASPAGTNGNFNPHIAAHATRNEWLLVSIRNYATVVGQRLRSQ